MRRFEYVEPSTLTEAVALLAERGDQARVLAGGTDVLTALKESGHRQGDPLEWVVSIGRIAGLDGLAYDARSGLRIGALVTARRVETSPLVRKHYPMLAKAVGTLASIQIRNLATVAGNICRASPSADTAPALLALDAEVRLVGPDGERSIALAQFFTGPGRTALRRGELLIEIRLPPPRAGAGVYVKHSPRQAMDLAAVGVAAFLGFADDGRVNYARVALGAVGPTPFRCSESENLLIGRLLTPESVEAGAAAAAAAAKPITDVRATANYRREIVRVLTWRCIAEAAEAAAWRSGNA
jgi:carbon-monoxide dehydrogenase medium subunit